MTVNSSPEYAQPRDLLKAVKSRVAAQSRRTGRPITVTQRDFIFQRFLARIFEEPESPWILKGGTGLRLRIPGARASQDIDLLHRGALEASAAVEALRHDIARRPGDHIWFQVVDGAGRPSRINPVTTVTVQAFIGASRYLDFRIDLAHDLAMVAPVERIVPDPVIEVPGLPSVPAIPCYPFVDQVADKVCAMYEVTASGRSSRYRDLVDLVLIVSWAELDAAALGAALAAESARRSLTLPVRLEAPGPLWADGYARLAAQWRIPAQAATLEPALRLVGACVEPVVTGEVEQGRWRPGVGWE